MLINTMEEESLSEGMVSQITVEYKMFGSDKMELMEGIGRAIRRILLWSLRNADEKSIFSYQGKLFPGRYGRNTSAGRNHCGFDIIRT